jgi:hypothetical protein
MIFKARVHVQRSYPVFGASVIVFSVIAIVIVVTNIMIIRVVCNQQKKVSVSMSTATIDMADVERGNAMDDIQQRQAREQQMREVKKQVRFLAAFSASTSSLSFPLLLLLRLYHLPRFLIGTPSLCFSAWRPRFSFTH